ncbi:MAG: hypothetical protein OIF50_09790 [Flavobacteriaceae bacterium]|nr:hypothetical protein [Flavobacteriaceae bacterium]
MTSEESDRFSWEYLEKLYPVSPVVNENRDKAKSSFTVIEDKGSWVDSFSSEDIQELPVGVKHLIGNVEYAIGVTKATITKDYTVLTVFARARLPKTNKNGIPMELFFGADNVKMSHQGGIIGDANLVLLGDVHMPFNAGKWMLTLKGGFDYKTGDFGKKTYATINCDGVKEMGIEGVVAFSRNLMIPLEENGEVNEQKTTVPFQMDTEKGTHTIEIPHRVKGEFDVVIEDWNDILVNISLQPFVLAKKRNGSNYHANLQFYLNEAVFDFSDLRNDGAVKFPQYYTDNGLLMPSKNAWRGVYVNSLEVKLPKEFKTTKTIKTGKRTGFGAHHLIIDNNGVSGDFYADQVISMKEGRTNEKKAWAYSLDHIEFSLAANQFIKGEMEGRILLPVSKNKKSTNSSADRVGLRYKGLISPDEYLLRVSNDSVVDFNLWKAKGQLLPNSAIELAVREGQFRPKAVLHGRLAISADQVKSLEKEGDSIAGAKKGKEKLVEFKGVVFQNLVLQTDSPVFQVDYMGYQDEVKLGGFPISIANVGIKATENEANLYFDLNVNLMGSANGFGGSASLGIIGAFEEKDHQQKWAFKGVELGAINVDTDLGEIAIKGGLQIMKDDPEYGNGFAAQLEAKFKSLELTVGAKGVFGKKDFRYWQFEAMVDGLNIGSGVVNIKGFSGGASYRMKRIGFSSEFSPTGIGYTPDADSELGVKAMVLLNIGRNEVCNGGAGFEINFNKHGGVNNLGFYGQVTLLQMNIPGMEKVSDLMDKVKEHAGAAGEFLAKKAGGVDSWAGKKLMDKAETSFPSIPNEKMSISAKMGITFDFQNRVMHGELDVFIKTPSGFLQGRGPGGRAGWAVVHVSPEEWYIHIGTPTDKIGIKLGVGPISLQTGSYFMVGTKLPGSPPPPPIVAEILGVEAAELDYMRDENALSNGGGFAFGADFSLDTGDLSFLIFYARLQAGVGFDIMLKDYGKAQCSNTGKQVGINGWYANGQSYAYLQGEIGVNIKLFFVRKKIPIIKGGAAVLMQAKAPNPVWMRGYVGGHFNVMGIIKGKFRFKLVIGKECELENAAPLGGLKMITDVRPTENKKEVDVFGVPQATFSLKVGEPVVLPEDDGDKTYRVKLKKFELTHEGKIIEGELKWANTKDRVNFVSKDILPPYSKLKATVTVLFEEKVNGIFRPIMVDGKEAEETEERQFTTGGAPNKIPLHNIEFAYPVVDQKYFLADESKKGYIRLKRGQDYLFEDNKWKTSIHFYKENNPKPEKVTFHYNIANNEVFYHFPKISQSTGYQLQIISASKAAVSENKQESTTYTTENMGEDNRIERIQNKAQMALKDGEIERLTYGFGVSKYKTFKQKVNAITVSQYNFGVIYSDIIYLSNRIKNHEGFDLAELQGNSYTNNVSLVQAEAKLTDAYYKKDIFPYLYQPYPISENYKIENRDVSHLGVPPKRALIINSSYLNYLENVVENSLLHTVFPYTYNLGLIYKQDWLDLQSQIVNDVAQNKPITLAAERILDTNYAFMRYGKYAIKMQYVLPGNRLGTSADINFKNPNKFRL